MGNISEVCLYIWGRAPLLPLPSAWLQWPWPERLCVTQVYKWQPTCSEASRETKTRTELDRVFLCHSSFGETTFLCNQQMPKWNTPGFTEENKAPRTTVPVLYASCVLTHGPGFPLFQLRLPKWATRPEFPENDCIFNIGKRLSLRRSLITSLRYFSF